jgi:acyl-CoA dehydrogenase
MSEERELLAGSVGRLFGDHGARRAAATASGALDAELWVQVEALELASLLVPEADGGSGGGFQDARVALRALGEHALPIPLAETLIASRALAAARIARPQGPLGLALRTRGELRESGGSWRFSGELCDVAWGVASAGIAAVLPAAGGARLCRLDPGSASSHTTRSNLADEPLDRLVFSDAKLESAPCPPALAGELFDQAALLRTAQICGALAAALSRSLAHASQRKQFGRALAQFQAVQQALALMGEEVLAAECASEAACRAADRDRASFEIACARLRAHLAIEVAVPIAHQVHGAIGFTREQDLRLFTQRLLAWRGEAGSDRYWADRLGRAVAARGAEAFWSDLTLRSDASAGLWPTGPRA